MRPVPGLNLTGGGSCEVTVSRTRASRSNWNFWFDRDPNVSLQNFVGFVTNVSPMPFILSCTGVVLSCNAATMRFYTNDRINPWSISAFAITCSPAGFRSATLAVASRIAFFENAQ